MKSKKREIDKSVLSIPYCDFIDYKVRFHIEDKFWTPEAMKCSVTRHDIYHGLYHEMRKKDNI